MSNDAACVSSNIPSVSSDIRFPVIIPQCVQTPAAPRPGERVVLWCLYDPDANEAKPWRVQWKEGGERMGTRKGRDDVRVKA